MHYRYAEYAKKNKKVHLMICLFIVVFFSTHMYFLLDKPNIWLLSGILIYIPIYVSWAKASAIKDRLPD